MGPTGASPFLNFLYTDHFGKRPFSSSFFFLGYSCFQAGVGVLEGRGKCIGVYAHAPGGLRCWELVVFGFS